MDIFNKFDDMFDIEGLKEDVEMAGDSLEFEDVPFGAYEVAIDKMEIVETKKAPARPMLSVWFRIVDGEFENQRIFYNQLLDGGFKIKLAMDFLNSLDSGHNIVFESFTQFGNLILDIKSDLEADGVEFGLEYGENDKGYEYYKIVDVFK